MDKFKQMMKDVKGMSPAPLNKDMERYKSIGNCQKSPTHTTCARNAICRFSACSERFHVLNYGEPVKRE